jgi:hypothetical protein
MMPLKPPPRSLHKRQPWLPTASFAAISSRHSVGHQAGRDLTVTQITNPHYFLEQARRADPHNQPFDYASYEDAQWGDLKTEDILEFLRLARVQITARAFAETSSPSTTAHSPL